MKGYRQGEILFIPVKREKESLEKLKSQAWNFKAKPDMVIREGEVTGHLHEIVSDGAELFEGDPSRLYGVELPKGDMYLTTDNQIKITHPEHATLVMPKGDYVIRIQREYDEAERYRYVCD